MSDQIPIPAFLTKSKESLTSTATHATVAPQSVDSILAERGGRYGPFAGHALITQTLKDEMRCTDGWNRLNRSQCEALEMIAHKIGRILNGDPNYADSWVDIGGYAELIVKQLNGKGI